MTTQLLRYLELEDLLVKSFDGSDFFRRVYLKRPLVFIPLKEDPEIGFITKEHPYRLFRRLLNFCKEQALMEFGEVPDGFLPNYFIPFINVLIDYEYIRLVQVGEDLIEFD